VLKADGPAAGKGVLIIDDKEEAKLALRQMIEGKQFGASSERVVVEQFLDGIEFSAFVITDGHSYQLLLIMRNQGIAIGSEVNGDGVVRKVPAIAKLSEISCAAA
jgi:phosphoribosylamine-glycine ligase